MRVLWLVLCAAGAAGSSDGVEHDDELASLLHSRAASAEDMRVDFSESLEQKGGGSNGGGGFGDSRRRFGDTRRRRFGDTRRRRFGDTRRRRCSNGHYRRTSNRDCPQCGSGHFQDAGSEHNEESCKGCPTGQFQNENAQSGCKGCASGLYMPATGAASCTKCEPGRFTPGNAHADCITCPGGKYQGGSGAASCDDCDHSCPAGQFKMYCGGGDGGVCENCPKGKFKPESGDQGCQDAPAGCFVPAEGALRYEVCPGGKFQDDVSGSDCKSCVSPHCPAGQHHENCGGHHPGTCVVCPAGRFKMMAGVDACTDCTPGKYADVAGHKDCKVCDADTYQPEKGKLACIACDYGCPAGKFLDDCGVAAPGNCTDCPAGKHKTLAASPVSLCSDCLPGRYQPVAGKLECEVCRAGQAQSVPRAHACDVCAPGRFAGADHAETCSMCAADMYQPASGASNCIGCPAGKFTAAATGSIACKPAPVAGAWNAWGAYAQCSKTCGLGTQKRTRACNAPVPLHGGAQCTGPATGTRICADAACEQPRAAGSKYILFDRNMPSQSPGCALFHGGETHNASTAVLASSCNELELHDSAKVLDAIKRVASAVEAAEVRSAGLRSQLIVAKAQYAALQRELFELQNW